ncbi:HAMP domain-containing histidine kinase [Candidatus Woesebacteria bacterium]|nr:HAMP domain-containing histidine kinase [Candidatus Woesebacteria bacterium]
MEILAIFLLLLLVLTIKIIVLVKRHYSVVAELRAANKRLTERDRLKNKFLAQHAQELRASMSVVRNSVWMTLNGKGGKINLKQREYLRHAYDSTNNLSIHLRRMTQVLDIQAGKSKLSIKKVDIRSLMRAVVKDIEKKADKKGVKVELQLGEEYGSDTSSQQSMLVAVDESVMRELLAELTENGIAFASSGSTVTVSVSLRQGEVEIDIESVDDSLELYFYSVILDLHGGKILIKPAKKKGASRCCVVLPVQLPLDS